MRNSSNGLGCVMGCWLTALAAGILLAALLMVIGGFAFTPAAFFGLLLFVLGGACLSWAFCKGNAVPASSAANASVSTSNAASAAPIAAATNSDAIVHDAPVQKPVNVKGGTTLSGEEELASRKGEWKYEGDAPVEGAPVTNKPAAKKPTTKKPTTEKAAAKPAKTPVKKSTTKAPEKTATKKAASKRKPVAKDGKPELLTQARDGGADDLKQIKGVGPKMEGMLNTMGIFHFDQVSAWRKAEVQWVDDNLEGFNGRVSRDEWVKQAKILAKGGTTEFSKKVDKGGVY